MKLSDAFRAATERLKAAGIDNPQLDTRWLFEHALRLDRAQLLSQSEQALSHEEIQKIDRLIARRETHESVARIIGSREFWGLSFGLNEATLEPRPDSETLIETVLSSFRRKPQASLSCSAKKQFNLDSGLRRNDDPLKILDLGTGTGCLLLSLLHELPNATGLGIDIAPRAVEQATQNAALLRLNNRAQFRIGNWLENITEKFDLIISNPPYIRADDIPSLMQDVRDYDPVAALDGGADGLDPYRHIIPQLPRFLNSGGFTIFEVGIGQVQSVVGLFRAYGFPRIHTHTDLGGIARCIAASLI